ncbi:FMN-dependent NADH-azoreductase [Novosphingobium sp. KACC 22771]|uniref:FMN-dependent NADH-azoreductase n=1 Tax=Novosphingobium sp. KACC 22771 TaxID=3025670 RepID=UPI0023665E45|nr:NAD(P)H-dependent oxidoreductase [Novosphingobium sp. KACC 22771]WDF71890.1 NAD(P)H-dependent oxidoreductase [Novosphingobium sp. KACC 22771]
MANVLVIRSAATGEASVSNKLINAYLAAHPEATVVERDLDANPVPHVDSASLAGIGRQAPEGDDFAAARSLQDAIIAEVFAADVLLIGLPVYNFGMPSTLKAWFDYVARAGTTFQYTEKGPEGLVKGKKAILAQARAGKYDDASGFPFAVPHAKSLLGFVGVDDVTVVTAEGMAFGPEAAEEAISGAVAQISAL